MFSDCIVDVENVSKRFELYSHPKDQLKQFILPKFQGLFGRAKRNYFAEYWALKNVSLHIRRGDSCGIVGMNGGGKSTLLQIIAGTLFPTSGSVVVKGRVSALLELGSGFNPSFTGRENVFFGGALLGLNRHQIVERMDEIQSFADIGDHFDQPLATYSSGMQMRLAFSVSTLFSPDILIIDEALAVGDSYFQQKCFRRLERFKDDGGTLIFVSHDASAVKFLCNTALLLDHGNQMGFGSPSLILDQYEGILAKKSDPNCIDGSRSFDAESVPHWSKSTSIVTNNDATLLDFKLLNSDLIQISQIESENFLTVRYVVRLNKSFERPAFGLIIRDRLGKSIFETSTYGMGLKDRAMDKGSVVNVTFNLEFNLAAGDYSFSIGVANKGIGRSEFEEYSLLMHDVEQIAVSESTNALIYGGVFNMRPNVVIEQI
jgi:ABC-type polysaccharide/polyol phosphate transport system ATPase subunit